MNKETVREILVQDLGVRKQLVPQNLTEEEKGRRLTLCMDFAEHLQEIIFWIVSFLVMKHAVISTIARPTANPWIEG
jgi:hypothetical protein